MSNNDDILRYETGNSALLFRAKPYTSGEYQEFLMDILSLANSSARGPRRLVFGIDRGPGVDRVVGLGRRRRVDKDVLTRLVSDNVEPPLKLRFRDHVLDEQKVCVLILESCSDRPYLLRRDYSHALRHGDGWIRKGVTRLRLGREDLDRIYQAKLVQPGFAGNIRVGFSGDTVTDLIRLPVIDAGISPSEREAERIRELLAAKAASHEVLGTDDSSIGRLVHARLYGADTPFEALGVTTLSQNLASVAEVFKYADKHYRFEELAHRINVTVVNEGTTYLEDVTFVAEIDRVAGMEIAEAVYESGPDCQAAGERAQADRYPTVETLENRFRVTERLGDIPHHLPAHAFRIPLRVFLTDQAHGQNIALRYILFARNLSKPVTGTLVIEVTPAKSDDLLMRSSG